MARNRDPSADTASTKQIGFVGEMGTTKGTHDEEIRQK